MTQPIDQIKSLEAEANEAFNNGKLYYWYCCLIEIANLRVMKRQAERKGNN